MRVIDLFQLENNGELFLLKNIVPSTKHSLDRIDIDTGSCLLNDLLPLYSLAVEQETILWTELFSKTVFNFDVKASATWLDSGSRIAASLTLPTACERYDRPVVAAGKVE